MKAKVKILTILLAFVLTFLIIPKHVAAQHAYVSYQIFYDQLSPYGQWVDYPNYGYVWVPDAGSDFVPYSTRGHWVNTEYGWTWVSDYDWGWAPFHYGRWDYDDYYGWLWVPDNEWGPSWVNWRRADGYYGWAPMEPGMTVSVSFGWEYDRKHDYWMFVRDRDFERSDINRYYVDRSDHERIIRNSTVINTTYIDNSRHTTYVTGPARDDVQRATGRKVSTVAIHDNNKPGKGMRNGQLQMYRPQVQNNKNQEHKPAPSRIAKRDDVKRPAERNAAHQTRNANSPGNNKRDQQPNKVNQQKSNSNAQPSQRGNVNPSKNKQREQQPNKVNPQKNNTNAQPSQRGNVNPSENKRRVRQPNTVNQQKNNTNAQPSQRGNVNPSENRRRERQPNKVNPQKNNSSAQPAQQQNVNPSGNSNPQQQPNTVQPSKNNRQPRNSNPRKGKRKTE